MGTLPLPGNGGEGNILPPLTEDKEARRRGRCRTTPHPHPTKEPEAKCEEETGSAYTRGFLCRQGELPALIPLPLPGPGTWA